MKSLNPFSAIWQSLVDWKYGTPLDTIIANEGEKAIKTVMECNYTIHREMFIRHMAIAEQQAQADWKRKEPEVLKMLSNEINLGE